MPSPSTHRSGNRSVVTGWGRVVTLTVPAPVGKAVLADLSTLTSVSTDGTVSQSTRNAGRPVVNGVVEGETAHTVINGSIGLIVCVVELVGRGIAKGRPSVVGHWSLVMCCRRRRTVNDQWDGGVDF